MYMFVLVTLIVAVIGIYTQVFNVQQAHMNAQQNGIAQAMLDWHATAVGLAENAVSPVALTTNNPTTLSCSLTQQLSANPLWCSGSNYGSVYISATGGVNVPTPNVKACVGGQSPPCYFNLPQGYTNGTSKLAFYSIAYQSGSQDYVLTFVPAPPAATGSIPMFVCLPGMIPQAACAVGAGQQQIDIAMTDLLNQIKRKGVSTFAYGTVNAANVLVTPTVTDANGNKTTFSYPLPAGLTLPLGSIGVISQISLCSSC